MPQDLMQIALEHHRAGRLRQAEAGYRAALDLDPGSPDAMHWLGVLALQIGRPADAVPLLEQAAAIRPADAAFQHNLAQAYLAGGRPDDAVPAFGRAAELDPDQGGAWLGLGLARLARRRRGDAVPAAEALRRAIAAGADSADAYHHLGVALLLAVRLDEAAAASRAAIDRDPRHAAAHHHLGLACHLRGDAAAARDHQLKALELDPEYTRAVHGLACLEAEAGNTDRAVALFRRAILLDPDFSDAYHALGRTLQRAGRGEEALGWLGHAVRVARRGAAPTPPPADPTWASALADHEEMLSASPDATDLHFSLAANRSVAPPPRVPAAAVVRLFDRYADRFDDHLRGALGYRVPELIADALAGVPVRGPLDVLDLGCGTGLCGPLLRPLARTLAGVDLSPAMVERARARGSYDRVEVADLLAALQSADEAFDLLVAADVFVYLGDLAPVFEAAAAALRPGGRLVFSVEAGAGDRYQLHPTGRFTHSEAYLRRVASMYGFTAERVDPITPRTDAAEPVQGLLVLLALSDRVN